MVYYTIILFKRLQKYSLFYFFIIGILSIFVVTFSNYYMYNAEINNITEVKMEAMHRTLNLVFTIILIVISIILWVLFGIGLIHIVAAIFGSFALVVWLLFISTDYLD